MTAAQAAVEPLGLHAAASRARTGKTRTVPKERTKRARIGRRGEVAFAAFSTKHHLLPTAPEEDVGFDYLCEVEALIDAPTRPMRGDILGVSVRSTSTKGTRVRLTRDDAERMLEARFPVCFVLVEVRTSTEVVHHRFLDSEFALLLAGFLESGRGTMSMTPSKCRHERDFDTDLRQALEDYTPEQVRLAVAETRLRAHLPRSALEVRRTSSGDLTVVSLENFYELFSNSSSPVEDRLYAAVFGAPRLRVERLAEVGPRPGVLAGLRGLPVPYFEGPVAEWGTTLLASGGQRSTQLAVTYHRAVAHSGWVHESGFSVTVSDAVKEEGVWVHRIEAVVDRDSNVTLSSAPDLWNFLEACGPESSLRDLDKGWTIETSYVKSLGRFSFYATCMRSVSTLAGFDQLKTEIQAAESDEALNTAAWLAEVAKRPVVLEGFGYVLGEQPLDDFEPQPRRVELAVVGNLGTHSAVSWLDAEVDWLAYDGFVRGLRINSVRSVRLEVGPTLEKESTWPELVVEDTWPTVAIGRDGPIQTQSDARSWGVTARDI